MKRHTKILSVVLALMLAAMLVPTALMQAFASDYEWGDTATADEPGKAITVTSFEITKSPDTVTYYKDYPEELTLYSGLEMMITFSDGTVYSGPYYSESLDEIRLEKGLYDTYDDAYLYIVTDLESLPLGKNTITYGFCGYTDTLEITVLENDPNAIVKIELTKLPEKVFSAPYFTGERPDNEDFEAFTAFFDDLDDSNSIANNMQGAELTFYRANGEQYVYAFGEHEPAMYMYGQAVYADLGILVITDLGDYKAHISYQDYYYLIDRPYEQDFTVNYTGNSSATTVTDPTLDNAENGSLLPSTADKTSSPDTATDDTATTGSSDNSVIETGNTVYYFAAVMLLMCAGAAVVFFSRKRLSGLN